MYFWQIRFEHDTVNVDATQGPKKNMSESKSEIVRKIRDWLLR